MESINSYLRKLLDDKLNHATKQIFIDYAPSLTKQDVDDLLSYMANRIKMLHAKEKQLHQDSMFACDLDISCSELSNRCKLTRKKYNELFDSLDDDLHNLKFLENFKKKRF